MGNPTSHGTAPNHRNFFHVLKITDHERLYQWNMGLLLVDIIENILWMVSTLRLNSGSYNNKKKDSRGTLIFFTNLKQ